MALQPTYGRIYASFPLKPTFIFALGLFAVGSVVCATAPQSEVLITGRALQGCGAAGIFSGTLNIGAYVVPLRRFPLLISTVASMYAVASAGGPIVGGILAASNLTWRFCFWINLRELILI